MKKRLCILLSAVVLSAIAGLFLFSFLTGTRLSGIFTNADTRRFHQLTEDFFAASFSRDSLSLHYTLADPSPYLEAPSPASLPVYSRKGQEESAALLENCLEALSGIDPEKLDSHDRYTYSLLLPYLQNELAGIRCAYFEEPLSPTSGMHTELPVLLAEYTFRSRQDVEDYFDILESIPAYLGSLAQYEKEKAAAGLFMTEADAAAVVEQCDRVLDPEQLEAEEHFLQTTFSERLDELIAAGELASGEKPALVSENNRLLRTVAAPAYVSLADDIFLLSRSGLTRESICQQKGGAAYYAYLLRRNTGSSRTPEEIKELLSTRLQFLFEELQELLAAYQEQTGQLPDGETTSAAFPLNGAEEILNDLQQRMAADFPQLTALTDHCPTCATKAVDASMEAYTSPAFYLTPPIDDLEHNVIYINNASTAPGLELYTTLAHEGYPGHLYQTVYSQLYENSQSKNPVRSALYYGGYVEGWAYYVENLAYTYAEELLAENGASEADRLYVRIACVERNLQVNLYCLLDLSIHYYGAEREEVYEALTSFGIQEKETMAAIYDYIRREPTTYLKYYLGYLEILSLQEQAMQIWGDAYTPLRFHTLLLEAGPSDFTNLASLLEG